MNSMKIGVLRYLFTAIDDCKRIRVLRAYPQREVISVFIALCAAVILYSASLPCTRPATWDPDPAWAA
jgi:hypothetical protein